MSVFLPIGIHHVWSYAKKVGRDPAASLAADVNAPEGLSISKGGEGETRAEHAPMTTTHKLVLTAVGMALAVMVYGLSQWDWYMVEMGAVFVALAVAMAIIARMSPDRTAVEFGSGAAALTSVRVLQSEAVRMRSVWAEIEFPALTANPNVTSITAVNPKTGVETLLWTR